MSSAMPQSEPTPIVACTVSRDVQNFDLLIEDMEAALGENWGDTNGDKLSPNLSSKLPPKLSQRKKE